MRWNRSSSARKWCDSQCFRIAKQNLIRHLAHLPDRLLQLLPLTLVDLADPLGRVQLRDAGHASNHNSGCSYHCRCNNNRNHRKIFCSWKRLRLHNIVVKIKKSANYLGGNGVRIGRLPIKLTTCGFFYLRDSWWRKGLSWILLVLCAGYLVLYKK